MNPIQLAKKRANDREAQRNIRQRNKELISRLTERNGYLTEQLETKENQVQQLLSQKKALEREVMTLREALSLPSDRPCQAPGMSLLASCQPFHKNLTVLGIGFDVDGLPPAVPSPVISRPSSFGSTAEYGTAATTSSSPFGASYLPTPEPCDSWSSVVPMSSATTVTMPSSAVSSPGGSPAGGHHHPHPADDYGPAGFIPTSVPPSMINGAGVMSGSSLPYRLHAAKMGYGELDAGKEEGGSSWLLGAAVLFC